MSDVARLLLFVPALLALVAPAAASGPDDATLRGWVAEMKTAPRGPFRHVRWFCKDGAVLPPEPFACRDRGGGRQHGELTERAAQLRERGFEIANVYASVDAEAFARRPDAPDAFAAMLAEQFLVAFDDGWILRRARYYRGAFQEEGERLGKRRLLFKLAEDPAWLTDRFVLLRTGAALLDHGVDTPSATEVRQLSATLASRDAGFVALRNKIHAAPQAVDAKRVREHARGTGDAALAAEYERLASLIDQLHAPSQTPALLRRLAASAKDMRDLPALLGDGAAALDRAAGPAERLALSARLMAELRDRVTVPNGPKLRVALLDASLALEREYYAAGAALVAEGAAASRRERLERLRLGVLAGYGAGLLSARQRDASARALEALAGAASPNASAYKSTLDYLALVPVWADRTLGFHFGEALERLARIEPLAPLFSQDHLRGGPLLFYAGTVEGLLRDANRIAGVRNELFGEDVGAGLRALNPGLARGTLRLPGAQGETLDRKGIYVLPETVAELPPVAGILTAGEGNPLSHVQLLARNLGIPNVGVERTLLPRIESSAGRAVVLAVSPAGSVRLAADGPDWDALFERESRVPDVVIRPDLEKLDLASRDLVPLSRLRASDSGRTVGPKAAKLGELAHHYPEAVAEGIAIPFGVFRDMLERTPAAEGGSLFDWMTGGYRALERMAPESAERAAATEAFRHALHERVLAADPGEAFRDRLREAMERILGPDGSYGVFVRSDTNVEDLPGFTGAGLNLTVANVVGFDKVLEAVSRVWASPFSERAFAWRQSRMSAPEHVYPAVLLMKSVPSEKSGVLVTRDIDSGAEGWLSIAVNEGVGGAVDGQAAESLRVNLASGEVRLLAQATARIRRAIDPRGGVKKLPASGADTVLGDGEIAALVAFARELPRRFPPIVDDAGRPAPADVEFGFLDGRLVLFQIRPFLESARARGSAFLGSLDADLAGRADVAVDLDAVPAA